MKVLLPFDIEKAKAGAKVVTRDGKNVTILDFCLKDANFPIVAKVQGGDGKESVKVFTESGAYRLGGIDNLDLLIVEEEPELTEFERKVSMILYHAKGKSNIEIAQEVASEVLKVAREEVCKEIPCTLQELNERYEAGYEAALQRMPKWKKADREIYCSSLDFAIRFKNDGGDHDDYFTIEATNRIKKGEWYFELEDLAKIYKELEV